MRICVTRPALANVVGYINVGLPPGYRFLTNPLETKNNSINHILVKSGTPDGSRAYLWDVANQVFMPVSIYDAAARHWSIDYDLPVGRGFVLFAPYSWTNTFVGEVLQGWLTNFVAGASKLSLIGNKVPMSASMSGIKFLEIDGADLHFFRHNSQKFSNAYNYFHGFGWFDPDGAYGTNGPFYTVAESFFVRNPGPDTNWIQNFVVPSGIALPSSLPVSQASAGPMIGQIAVASGMVTLRVENPGGEPYDVQFSTDGREWVTVATNQVRELWVSPVRNATCGYYKVSNR